MLLDPLIVPREVTSNLDASSRREWLEANGLGGFAMGTVAGASTRRYHALLCAAQRPPVERMVLVNRCEEELEVGGVRHPLSTNFYPGVVHPDGYRAIEEFRLDPWPTWIFRAGGLRVERTLFMVHGHDTTVLSWRLSGEGRARLFVRPLISGRDYHALHQHNDVLRPGAEISEGLVVLAPYDGVPPIYLHHDGVYRHAPDWYFRFQYPVERERGLDDEEDLFSPGELSFELGPGAQAVLVLTTEGREVPDVAALRERERTRRQSLPDGAGDPAIARLRAAADSFVVAREKGHTLLAGYPWFTDWGRDTFIALPGLALATGRVELAGELLCAFASRLDGGLIPNRFPDGGEAPEYNAADAPLWFVLAVCRFARAGGSPAKMAELRPAVRQILEAYLGGTRYNIGLDDDGLIHASSPGVQLTWMDAKFRNWVVTPRMGKPVEIQALWVAALEAVARLSHDDDPAWAGELSERAAWARSSFAATFWDESRGWLCDVVDGPRKDPTLRPNQLYALGLCAPLIDPERAARALAACERELLTPVGLRSRARDEGYRGRFTGDQRSRDGAYHQGTVWPYLLGIYADACRRVRGEVPADLLDGVRAHLHGSGLGTLCEVFDGDPPHTPRGCIAQAWSVAEILRIAQGMVAVDP